MARRADMLIADSHFTSDEIRRVLGVPRDRIRVVHLAADDRPVPAATDDRATLERLGVRRPYLLSVGADDRRKNLDLLQRVMDRLAVTLPELTLVQVGPRRRSWLGSDPTQAGTQTLGFVTDEALTALYRSAAALVMPSRYEGFGLPVLEAMRLGTPVICTRASSLPEVAGPAAAWVDPGDAEAFAEAFAKTITSVVTDGATSARLRAGGELRATLFSWDETARRTLQVFDEARRRAAALAWL
jgi:glycosyltransferase involved in cell wall biosynthesis